MEVTTPKGTKVDGARLLVELVSGTEPLGLGKVVAAASPPFTLEDAQEILSNMDESLWYDEIEIGDLAGSFDKDEERLITEGKRLVDAAMSKHLSIREANQGGACGR